MFNPNYAKIGKHTIQRICIIRVYYLVASKTVTTRVLYLVKLLCLLL